MQYSLYEPPHPHVPKLKEEQRRKKIRSTVKIGVIALAVFIAVWALWYVWPTSPKLIVILGVEADLILDDIPQGQGTTFEFPNLAVGKHTLTAKPKITAPFLAEQTEHIELQFSEHEFVRMLQVSKLSVSSKPEGAVIQLTSSDEGIRSLGRTPIETVLPFGRYDGLFLVPGYPEAREQVLSSGDDIALDLDFEALALSEGGKKLNENLQIGSLPSGAIVSIDGKGYLAETKARLSAGFHKMCLYYNNEQVICSDVILPTVGEPLKLAWPSGIEYPCLYFGEGLYLLPKDARNIMVSQDGKKLLFNNLFGDVTAVDLETGQELWNSKIDQAFDFRPAMLLGSDSEKVFGTSGWPPDPESKTFALDIEKGVELDMKEQNGGSSLPFLPSKYQFGQTKCYAQIWEGPLWRSGMKRSIECVIERDGVFQRFTKEVEFGNAASFLGVSVAAKSKSPVFVFQTVQVSGYGSGSVYLLFLQPNNGSGEGNWIKVKAPFEALGVCFDGGFDTGGCVVLYGKNQAASVRYPSGELAWRYYFDETASIVPTIVEAKGRPVLMLNFRKPPFEVHLDLKTGEELLARKTPRTAEEAIDGEACPGGSFVIGNSKVVAGVKKDMRGDFMPTWTRVYTNKLVKASPWGPLIIENGVISLLGSHKLDAVLTFKLPGLGTPSDATILGDSEHLAILAGQAMWIVDRYGMVRGYFTGVNSLAPIESGGHKAMMVEIGNRKAVVPWP